MPIAREIAAETGKLARALAFNGDNREVKNIE
jgi:hypothetical protein